MNPMKSALLGGVLLLASVAAGGAAVQQTACPVPQSPRNMQGPYDGASTQSIVTGISPTQDELHYRARQPGAPDLTLYRCGQHYHVPVEDVQGCRGEADVTSLPASAAPWVPSPDQWIEVHTAYSSVKPPVPCPDPESLNCCDGTVLVLGFSAKVSAMPGGSQPILTPPAHQYVEWSGSNTGTDKVRPTDCKPTAAAWSFRLGCNFTVGTNQLGANLPGGPQGARPLQAGARVSNDLTLVTPAKH